MTNNIIITIISLLVGFTIALLYFLFPAFFINLQIPFIIVALAAIASLGITSATAVRNLAAKQMQGIGSNNAVSEYGTILVLSSISVITISLIALTIPWTTVTTLTFIVLLLVATSVTAMLLSLVSFIKTLIKQN
jgi:phosphatidylglycerophosphate synthase